MSFIQRNLIDRDVLLSHLIIDSRLGAIVTVNAIMAMEVNPDQLVSEETFSKTKEMNNEKAENVKNWQKLPISDAEKRLKEVVRYDND